jgi:molybdopterin-containing oxidoreductase family membrane subunit
VFLLVQSTMYAWNGQELPEAVRQRMARLLGVFVAAALYLVAVYHLTNLYFAKQGDFEAFILLGRGDPVGVFPALFWGGYVLLGALLPMALLFHPRGVGPNAMLTASVMVVAGAFALLFVFIVGGQSFPLEIFPGHVVTSPFADGQVELYTPRWPEWLLGIGGLGAAFVLTLIGVRALDVLPHDELKP